MLQLADLWTDLRRAARALAATPVFSLPAVATLALGIGASTALFSVVNAVLLRPLPYDDAPRRAMVWSRWKDFDKTWVSEAELLDYRRLVPSFARVAAWATPEANLTGDGPPVRVGVGSVTANAFPTLGAEPLLGRGFTEAEERPGGEPVVVIGHGLWQRRFGADPRVLGRTLQLDGVTHAIVGVMPPGFQLPTDFAGDAAEPSELWRPLAIDPATVERGNHGLYAAAELRAGASFETANAELATLTRNLTREGLYPEAMRFSAFVIPLEDEIVGGVRPALLLVSAAVALLLMIACVNVSHLLLARCEGRLRELAVRQALGAGRGRLLRQMLAEAAVLALPAGLAGMLLAEAGVRLLLASGVEGLPRGAEAGIDARALGVTAALALLSAVAGSLAPAWRALRLDLNEALRDSGRGSVGARRQRLRGGLVVAEMALSVALLLGAGLTLRSLHALRGVDLGFAPEGGLTARLSLPEADYPTAEAVAAFHARLLEALRVLPGVERAGLVRSLPLASQIGDWGLQVEGYTPPPGQNAKGDWQVVSEGGVEALGERLRRGRAFTAADTAAAEPVGLVNETLARTYWPGQDPLGRRFRMGSRSERPWIRVVGVVGDVRHNGVRAPIKEKFYVPFAQFPVSVGFPLRSVNLVVRAAGEPRRLAAPLRAVVGGLDPRLPLASLRTLDEVVARALVVPRLAGSLLALFAALALVLAAVGVYGVLAHLVRERTQEIGVRLALGATGRDVTRLVLRRGLALSASGIGLGGVASLGLARLLRGLLHDVGPHDALTFAAAPLVLLLVAALASWLPARTAAGLDPLVALRAE